MHQRRALRGCVCVASMYMQYVWCMLICGMYSMYTVYGVYVCGVYDVRLWFM